MTLRHAGLRVAELCDLRVGDVTTSERKGALTVRAGKGMKQRTVPLNADMRRAIATYLNEERPGADAGEFLRKGVPLTAVGALLGHESLQSTARYTQPSERDLRDAVQNLALEDER